MAFLPGDTIHLDKVDQVIVYERELDVFDFVWSIKNFSNDQNAVSPIFKSPKTGTQWSLEVSLERMPNFAGHWETRRWISLKLDQAKTPFPVKTTCALHFLNSKMKVHRGYSYSHDFTKNEEIYRPFEYNPNWFMEADESFVSDDGSLNLFFRVTIHTAEKVNVNANRIKYTVDHLARVGQQYKTILENGEFSDLTVKTNKSSFPVSKIILAGQSPVFKAMLLSDMLESKENVVNIEDFSDETVKGFLEFLYSGQCESLKENVMELLKISEKYEVVHLKRECEKILINTLNKKNAAEMFYLASFYNAPELKSQVVAFVKMYNFSLPTIFKKS